MSDTRTTLETTGADATAELTEAVEALRDCEETSTACAMAMAATGGMATEVRRALDCADQCAAAARVLRSAGSVVAGVAVRTNRLRVLPPGPARRATSSCAIGA